MTIQLHSNLSTQRWHELRAGCITSTEVAALFGLSPYETAFELWHRKKRGEQDAVEENERMKWGNRLQDAIADGIAEDNGWNLSPCDGMFWLDDKSRIGASADYRVIHAGSASFGAILEIKNVDSLAFKQGWVAHEDGEVEAPPHIELQVQHQMILLETDIAYIGALVGGNTVRLLRRDADSEVQAQIKVKVAEFWRSIAEDQPPPFDPIKDYDAVLQSSLNASNSVLRADDGSEHAALVAQLVAAQQKAKEADDAVTSLKTRIAALMSEHAEMQTPIGKVKILTVTPTAGTLITPEMVGTYYGARKGSKQFRFYPKGAK